MIISGSGVFARDPVFFLAHSRCFPLDRGQQLGGNPTGNSRRRMYGSRN
jgi:hypothetical protein